MPRERRRLGVSRNHKPYSLREEIANAITHGIGTGLSVAGLTLLAKRLKPHEFAAPGQKEAVDEKKTEMSLDAEASGSTSEPSQGE